MRIASLPALLSRSLLTSASAAGLSSRATGVDETGYIAFHFSKDNSVVRCLDGLPTPGNHVQLWPCNEEVNPGNQQWGLLRHPASNDEAFYLFHLPSGLCAHYDLGDCRDWLRTRLTCRHR